MPVPLVLTVNRSATDPETVDLTWTGQAARFGVYRSISPENTVSPANFVRSTEQCAETDQPGVASEITFYSVVDLPPVDP
jgi:hypothetical protein